MAMSRHRLNAKLYVDRSGFSQDIDWKALEGMKTKEKIKTFNEIAIKGASEQMAKPQEKDTTRDYKMEIDLEKEEYIVSPKVRDLAIKLQKERSRVSKMKLVAAIALEHQGSEHKLKTPRLETAFYQRFAIDILKEKDLGATAFLIADILKAEVGFEVSESSRIKRHKEAMIKEVKPLFDKAVKHFEGIEKAEQAKAKEVQQDREKKKEVKKGKGKGFGYGFDM